MSKTSVPFAPETLETIQRAIRFATDRRHDTVGLEHLLLAVTDEPQARRILVSCGADVEHAAPAADRGAGQGVHAGARSADGGAGADARLRSRRFSRR